MEVRYILLIIGFILVIVGMYSIIQKKEKSIAVVALIFAFLSLVTALFLPPVLLPTETNTTETTPIIGKIIDNTIASESPVTQTIFNSETPTEPVITSPENVALEPETTIKQEPQPSPLIKEENIWVYYIDPLNEHKIYKMRTDGSEKTLFINASCEKIISMLGNKLYYQEATYHSEDGNESWTPTKAYSVNLDNGEITELPVPEYSDVDLISDGYAFYRNLEDGYYYMSSLDESNKVMLSKDNIGAHYLVNDLLYYTNLTDDYSFGVLNINSPTEQKRISKKTFSVGAFCNGFLYLTETIWVDNNIGGSWQYGRLYKLDIEDNTIYDLGFDVSGVERVISVEDNYIYYSTSNHIERIEINNGKIGILATTPNEVFFSYKNLIYYYAYSYDAKGQRHSEGIYVVSKDGSQNNKLG